MFFFQFSEFLVFFSLYFGIFGVLINLKFKFPDVWCSFSFILRLNQAFVLPSAVTEDRS